MKLFILLFLAGCTPMTELEREQREWRRAIDLGNWELCEKVYDRSGEIMWHVGHIHRRGESAQSRAFSLRSDLATNKCRHNLGDYWIEY